jgi:hypothetical protein
MKPRQSASKNSERLNTVTMRPRSDCGFYVARVR